MAALICEIEGLLASKLGLDPVSVGPKQIWRAVQQRMQELGLADVGEYESWVRKSESELQALIEEVVVSESWFFRDERPFQYFRDYVGERWLNDPLRPPLRVLSLACAGGEEPYSIAIGLRELGLTAQRFHIDAVDISADDWRSLAAEFTRQMPSAVPISVFVRGISASIHKATNSMP